MIWYRTQLYNPSKHRLMPDNYPWEVSDVHIEGFIEIENQSYHNLVNSIDLSSYNKALQEEQNLARQTNQREFGATLIPSLIDSMGERNLTLSQNGTTTNTSQLASDNAGIKLLIETGALGTARTACSYLRNKYPLYSDIYNNVIIDITQFLIERGYE